MIENVTLDKILDELKRRGATVLANDASAPITISERAVIVVIKW